MSWLDWIASMSWREWSIVTLASSTGVALLARHLTKAAISHGFQVDLERVKANHTKELEDIKANNAKSLERLKAEIDFRSKEELERIKAEIALFSNKAANELEQYKARHMIVANIRANSYPKLVAILRHMKRQFEGLQIATGGSVEEGNGPVNLSEKSRRANYVKKALAELAALEKEFDDEIYFVRLFTNRSDYLLQALVQSFCREWKTEADGFTVTHDLLRRVVDDYNDDISYLSEEFYRPEISVPQSGEALGLSAMFGFNEGAKNKYFENIEAVRAEAGEKKQTFDEWLISRRPGSPLLPNDKHAEDNSRTQGP